MRNKTKDALMALVPFIAIVIAWYALYNSDFVPKWLNASPHEVASTLARLIRDGTVFRLVLISGLNSAPPFIVALAFALILGTVIGISNSSRKLLFPFLSAVYPVPSLAWLPLIILVFGFTRMTIWAVIFVSCFMKMIYNVVAGVKGVDPSWILAARNFGLSDRQIIFKVVLPGALPQIMTGVRLGFGSSWRSLVGAEMLAASIGGIGKFMWMAQWYYEFDKVVVGIVVIAVVGFAVERFVFNRIEHVTLVRWGMVQEER